ncbi:MAG: phosphopantetheine-binding protein [Oceanipulchritudo sp.]
MPTTNLKEEELRESLKRCPERAIEAAIQFNQTRDPELVPTIVMGIIERFVEPEVRPLLREEKDQTRLLEDLGIDSLLMVEIVILVEETLGIQIENEELRNLRSIGDIKGYLDAKIKGLPVPSNRNVMKFEEVAAVMPHQPPFLFLQEARINGTTAEGSYHISGDEPFLEGHFKENPVFPASLMLEALGQLAVLLMLKSGDPAFGGRVRPDSIYFVSCDGVRCHKMCKPEEVLQLKVSLKKVHAPLAQFEGLIFSHGTKVAKAEEISLTFELAEEEPTPAN